MGERQVQPRLGTRKLHFLFQTTLGQEGVKIGRDRLFELLKKKERLLEKLPASFPRTTSSSHYLPVFKNRIKDIQVSQPNEVWVGDLGSVLI